LDALLRSSPDEFGSVNWVDGGLGQVFRYSIHFFSVLCFH
jgi:hypothetical protein